jgi:hypothetical protein
LEIAQANGGVLPRDDAQRRFDALLSLFRQAIETPVGGKAPEPVVNINITAELFEAIVEEAATGETPTFDPAVLLSQRCETTTGIPIHPRHVLAAAIIGHVRRVVVNAKSNTIDLGRRSRVFTGSAKVAVHLLQPRCSWAGCDIPAGRCQTDHLDAWAALLGPTSPSNGTPLCPWHNRFKQHGYRLAKHDDGTWHTYRPDGTDLTHPR